MEERKTFTNTKSGSHMARPQMQSRLRNPVLTGVILHLSIFIFVIFAADANPALTASVITLLSLMFFLLWRKEKRSLSSEPMEQTAEQTDPDDSHLNSPLLDELKSALEARDEKDAVLSSMSEAVIAVNADYTLLSINASARKMLNLPDNISPGLRLQEVVQEDAFHRIAKIVLETGDQIENEIRLEDDQQRLLFIHGTPLLNKQKLSNGAVIVFRDISRIRKLETIHQEFVANVSHELKTPITSIKGFVETLLNGALANRADAERFLAIVSRQADRLSTIIEDLLSLSRLERQGRDHELSREDIPVATLFERCYQGCLFKLDEKQVRLNVNFDHDLFVSLNLNLMEQALMNLLSNAIKYSSPDSEILLEARRAGQTVSFSVSDSGIGIAEEDLPRIFERFYRVDRARSRQMGGSGLGLAIVKHIAQVHGGSVHVESAIHKGSRFEIVLPLATRKEKWQEYEVATSPHAPPR